MPRFFTPIALILVVYFVDLQGQELINPGSRALALAGSTVALSDSWSVFGNQAGLASINQPEIAGTYSNRFLIAELSERSGQFILPVQNSVFAVSLFQFGKSTFRSGQYGIAYARKLSPTICFGLQYNFGQLYLPEENRYLTSSGIELGLQFTIQENLVIGIHARNLYSSSFRTLSAKLDQPLKLKCGTYYRMNEMLAAVSELEYSGNEPVMVRSGFEYQVIEGFFLRVGASGKPFLLSSGIGFQLGKFTVDLATSYHRNLGNSPSVSCKYRLQQ